MIMKLMLMMKVMVKVLKEELRKETKGKKRKLEKKLTNDVLEYITTTKASIARMHWKTQISTDNK